MLTSLVPHHAEVVLSRTSCTCHEVVHIGGPWEQDNSSTLFYRFCVAWDNRQSLRRVTNSGGLLVWGRQHPWFTLHLPRYLAVMQADTIASTAMIDDEIVHEVVKLGFRRHEVVDSIRSRAQNKVGHRIAPVGGWNIPQETCASYIPTNSVMSAFQRLFNNSLPGIKAPPEVWRGTPDTAAILRDSGLNPLLSLGMGVPCF